jgi:transposase
VQDRQDRLARLGDALPPRPGAGDLAARSQGQGGTLARFRLHLVKHKSALKNRIHSTLINFGKPCAVTDLFGVEGRELLARLQVPEPWRSNVTASLALIDELERQIDDANRRLKASHADHPYIPLLMSAPGVGWLLAFTIAAELGEIERFASPEKLAGYTGLCPRVNQSEDKDRRGPLTKHGPTYLRWALLEATMHALKHPAYAQRYQRTKRRLGKQRGAKVAQIDIARRLAPAIWHMLSRNQQFAPTGAAFRLAA